MEYDAYMRDKLYVTMDDGKLHMNQMAKAHMVNIFTFVSFPVFSLFISYEHA